MARSTERPMNPREKVSRCITSENAGCIAEALCSVPTHISADLYTAPEPVMCSATSANELKVSYVFADLQRLRPLSGQVVESPYYIL